MQPDLSDNSVTATLYHDWNRATPLHRVGALLIGTLDASTTSQSQPRYAPTRIRANQPTQPREESGLVTKPTTDHHPDKKH